MECIIFILLFCTTVQQTTSFDVQQHAPKSDNVIDLIANHPIIKQLVARVNYLEEKDRLDSELIRQLQAELNEYKTGLNVKPAETSSPDGTSTDIPYTKPEDVNTNDTPPGKPLTEQHRGGSEQRNKRKVHPRIRQIEGAPVAFFVKSTAKNLHLGPNQNVMFETVTTNLGNGFNSHHGVFIAPVSGTYVFFSTILADNNAEVWTHFAVNGSPNSHFYARGTDGRHDSGSQMIIVTLTQGDDVSVQSDGADESIYGEGYTTFSGFLLSNINAEPIG